MNGQAVRIQSSTIRPDGLFPRPCWEFLLDVQAPSNNRWTAADGEWFEKRRCPKRIESIRLPCVE
eukprot:15164403-Alexandrium_andersonii.AAC.1